MKKLLLISFLLLNTIHSSAKEESLAVINKKISKVKHSINVQKKEQNKIKHNINSLAKSIIQARNKHKKLLREQESLEAEIKTLSKDSMSKQKEIKNLEALKDDLVKTRQTTELKLIDLLTNNISKTLIVERIKEVSANDIIKKEIFKKTKEHSDSKIKKIKKDFLETQKKVANLESRIEFISATLKSLIDKKERVAKLKKEKKILVASLSHKQERYSRKLSSIINEKQETRKFLASLGIIKQKALRRVKERERQEQLARNGRYRDTKRSNTKVVKYGSSYLAVGRNHYKGRKVAPPIDTDSSFKVTKKFGPFVDPIYDIKIHNDFVTLRADEQNSVIRNVLDGKVVFADTLPMLGKVVIVDNRHGIHTIYRKLDKISPNVTVKSKIKKREAIGRIDRELEFEVTKDSIPINPLELIHVSRTQISSL